MSTSKVPDLTMTHADSLHYQPTQGCGNFVYKILVLGHQKAQVEPIHVWNIDRLVWNIDKDFMVHELTPVLHRRSTLGQGGERFLPHHSTSDLLSFSGVLHQPQVHTERACTLGGFQQRGVHLWS
jgi:hypothetical protein